MAAAKQVVYSDSHRKIFPRITEFKSHIVADRPDPAGKAQSQIATCKYTVY